MCLLLVTPSLSSSFLVHLCSFFLLVHSTHFLTLCSEIHLKLAFILSHCCLFSVNNVHSYTNYIVPMRWRWEKASFQKFICVEKTFHLKFLIEFHFDIYVELIHLNFLHLAMLTFLRSLHKLKCQRLSHINKSDCMLLGWCWLHFVSMIWILGEIHWLIVL